MTVQIVADASIQLSLILDEVEGHLAGVRLQILHMSRAWRAQGRRRRNGMSTVNSMLKFWKSSLMPCWGARMSRS